MSVKMTVSPLPSSDENRPEVKHAREVDRLKAQCNECKLWKPKTPTKDCAIREKLVQKDSEVGWKNKHLFLHKDGKCKMFQSKEKGIL